MALLTKPRQKAYLANDLIERMIRVEQRVCAHFRNFITYDKTEFYKSLTHEEQKRFDSYMRHKKSNSALKIFAGVILPLILLFMIKVDFTGNVIRENFTMSPGIELGFIALIVIVLASFVISIVSRNRRYERYDPHFKVVDDVLSGHVKHTKLGRH